jgi:serine palmitoyltransferase
MPGMLAMAASEGIQILTSTPSILSNLHTNIFTLRSVLDKIDCITIPSHPASAIIHIQLRDPIEPAGNGLPTTARAVSRRPSNPTSLVARDLVVFDIGAEEKLLQEVVDEALAQGILITRARRLRGQEALEPRPSIKIAASAAVSKKDTEKAASILKGILIKVLGKK